jgi:hypothetical protein
LRVLPTAETSGERFILLGAIAIQLNG